MTLYVTVTGLTFALAGVSLSWVLYQVFKQ